MVLSIKMNIEEKWGIPTKFQCFQYEGHMLHEFSMLKGTNIFRNAITILNYKINPILNYASKHMNNGTSIYLTLEHGNFPCG